MGVATSYLTNDFPGTSIGLFYDYLSKSWGNNQVYNQNSITTLKTVPSSGTFTITYKASTTVGLAYNALDATIQAAINGLADVIADGITVTTANDLGATGTLPITLTAGSTTSRFTGNGASLGPAASRSMFTVITTTIGQQINIGYRATLTGHGFNASNPVLLYSTAGGTSNKLLPGTTWWAVVDANTLAFQNNVGAGATLVGQLQRTYTPGTDRVGTKLSQMFYLPGVTTGITTPTDIPIPSPLLNDVEFLTAVVTYLTGYQTYDSSALGQWLDTPIYTQTGIQINMADV